MANQVQTFKENLPVHLQRVKLDDFTKAFTSSGGSVKRISLRGRVFRLVDGGKEIAKNTEPHLDVVIVNGSTTVQKTYHAKSYDPEETSIPDCWSSNGERPDPEVEDPQSSNCKECPKAIKGSAGGTKTSCRFSQRVAVVLANNPGGDVYQLVVPSKSLFGAGDMEHMPFLQYARYVGNSGFNLNMLTTRLTFDLDSDVPKLFFSNVEFLDVDTHNLVIEQGQSAAAINAGKLSFKKKGETAASAEMPKLVAPAGSAAAKVKAAEAAKPEAKPAAKPKAAEPAPAKDTGLSTLVDEWGDDQ
jgi:cell division septation protein DedD